MLARQTTTILLADQAVGRHCKQRVVSLEIIRRQEERLVGGDQRQVSRIGEFNGRRLDGTAVIVLALQLDIKPVAKNLGKTRQPRLCNLGTFAENRLANGTAGSAGQCDDALGMLA